MSITPGALHLLMHPYEELVPLRGGREALKKAARTPGSALVWAMQRDPAWSAAPPVQMRPGGLALIVVLPEAEEIDTDPGLILNVQLCRPQGILPHHEHLCPHDLAQVLRRPPVDLPADVTDYLGWRGLGVDRETLHLIRRIFELSAELRSITALARSMYLSRRALGRRLLNRGLPVPSHWLQFGRLLRLAIRLQNSDDALFSIAYEAGYPDGFSVSNQMNRLVGFRPSYVRERLGWEWLVEEWLRKEAEEGGLSPTVANVVSKDARPRSGIPARRTRPRRTRRKTSKK